MTPEKRAGRPSGAGNLVLSVRGQDYDTHAFRKLLLDTVADCDPDKATVAQIIEQWRDPIWTTADRKKLLATRLMAQERKGNLERIAEGRYRRTEGAIRQSSLDDYLDLMIEALTEAGGTLSAKELWRAIDVTTEQAAQMKLADLIRRRSPIRRDFRATHTYNLPMEMLRNIVISPRTALAICRARFLGQNGSMVYTALRPWKHLNEQFIATFGAYLQQARQDRGLTPEEVVGDETIKKLIRVCAGEAAKRQADTAAERRAADKNTFDTRLDYYLKLEDPYLDLRPDPTRRDEDGTMGASINEIYFASMSTDLIRALADLLAVDPVALSWATIGVLPEWGYMKDRDGISQAEQDMLEFGEGVEEAVETDWFEHA
ncbi:hypothetical protein CcrC1_gp473 [Caulobacter phage C1]|nr:hypothetical protein CcrC1_gp473 [Caulobacter phage C1]UTU08683.1 hypothetical protein CcrC2_gp455 [Caulobacter phage C2]WGN97349.1 hypothetical protein [Bertelyvirus sp.]WGN97887.1 hypothetical protein [Bertelyvirus sp.]